MGKRYEALSGEDKEFIKAQKMFFYRELRGQRGQSKPSRLRLLSRNGR